MKKKRDCHMDLKNVTQLYVSNKKFSEVQTLTQSKYLREKSFMDLEGLKPDTVFSILSYIKKNNTEKNLLTMFFHIIHRSARVLLKIQRKKKKKRCSSNI